MFFFSSENKNKGGGGLTEKMTEDHAYNAQTETV